MGTIWKKIRQLFLKRRFEADLAEELRFHRAMLEHAGGDPTALGNATLASEDSRAVWTFRWLETLLQDLRYALRGFLQTPAFALTVIGTIGLGLGLNTTLFTVFNAYVLRPVAVRDPYGLYEFDWRMRDYQESRSTWDEYQALSREGIAFSSVAATDNLQGRINGFPMFGHLVSGNYFQMLGEDAGMGRVIAPEDAAAPGSGAVIVFSYSAWKNRLGGDPNILGSKIVLRGEPFEVIGVTRAEFSGINEVAPDFWIPLTMSAAMDPLADVFAAAQPHSLLIVGRLKPDLSPGQAQARLAVWAQHATAMRREGERA